MTEVEAGPSSSNVDSGSDDIDVEAIELLGQGKRNLVVGDAPAAVQCLQEACALFAAKYGEMSNECGEVYYQYGCALLELASMENGVLGNALQGVPDESADSDEEEVEKKPDESNVESADTLEDEGAGPSAEEPDTTEGEDDGEKSDQKEDGEDISNFQLAWEMLELARVIMGRKDSKEFQMKVSQIHLKLGELGLETEQYVQSVVDFNTCLEIQKKFLDPQSRLLAGTHYNLGLAYSFAGQFDSSIEHYRQSKQIMEQRLASLEKKVAETDGKGKEKADEDDPIVKDQKEIDELKELLPDIVSKLEDAKEMKLQQPADGAGSSTSSGFAASSSFAPSTSSEPIKQIDVKKPESAPARDITHLVRRKRKPDEEEESAPSADSKRIRKEDDGEQKMVPEVKGSGDAKVTNGDGQVNGHCNGDEELSPEKPMEFKTKSLPSDDAPAAMETA